MTFKIFQILLSAFLLFLPLVTGKGSNPKLQREKGKILMMADNIGTHYPFTLSLANSLSEVGYDVHFVSVFHPYWPPVATPTEEQKERITFVNLPHNYTQDKEFVGFFKGMDFRKLSGNWEHQLITETPFYWDLLRYFSVASYKAIVENPLVSVGEDGQQVNVLDWLRENAPSYKLAIAEYSMSSSAFALFHELGINKFVATSAVPPMPAFVHFLGGELSANVPEQNSAEIGDGNGNSGIRVIGSRRQRQNIRQYKFTIAKMKRIYNEEYGRWYEFVQMPLRAKGNQLKEIPPLETLFRKAIFYLSNIHPLAMFGVPMPSKVVPIGGVHVESTGIIPMKFTGGEYDAVWKPEADCIVLFIHGTMITFNGIHEKTVETMFDAFARHGQCQFLVRIKAEAIPEKYKNLENVEVVDISKRVDQQGLLAQKNVRAFISHCGQNSFNESLYAGVPVICMPTFGDQNYNAAIAEYLGVGKWVKVSERTIVSQFAMALNSVLTKASFRERALEIAHLINRRRGQQTAAFHSAIERAINWEHSNNELDGNEPINNEVEIGHIPVKDYADVMAEWEQNEE